MRIGRYSALLVMLSLGSLGPAAGPDPEVPPKHLVLKRSKQTTWFTGPVNPDGTVNYYQALYGKLAAQATPVNNAAVPLIRALGAENLYPWLSYDPDEDPSPRPRRDHSLRRKQIAMRLMGGLGLSKLDTSQDKVFVEFQDWQLPARFADQVDLPEGPGDREALLQHALAGPWTPQENLAVALWLEEMDEPLGRLRAAAELPVLYLPQVPTKDPTTLLGTLLPSIGRFRKLSGAMLARAQMRAGQGNWQEARADVLAVVRLGHLLQQTPETITQLMALAIVRNAHDAAGRMSFSKEANARALARLAEQLQKVGPLDGCVQAVDVYERVSWLDTILMIARGIELNPQRFPDLPKNVSASLWKQGLVDWNGILADANRLFDARRAYCSQPDDRKRREIAQAYNDLWDKAVPTDQQVQAAAEQFGKDAAFESLRRVMNLHFRNMLLSMRLAELSGIRGLQQEGVIRHRQVLLALHLGAVRCRTGRYPGSLQALPEDVRAWAEEPFAPGRKMKYERTETGFRLTSVGGSGRVDSEGNWERARPIVLELPEEKSDDRGR